jgi:hypothetical protein
MPHAGELLSMLGTLRGEGSVSKRDNSLIVVDGSEVLTDELGNALLDDLAQVLTE